MLRMTNEDRDNINAIFQKYSQGEVEAFDIFCERYYEIYYTFMLVNVKDEYIAEDLTQELFKKLQNLDFTKRTFTNISGYIFRIATNMFLKYFNKNKEKRINELSFTEVGEITYRENEYENILIQDFLDKTLTEEERLIWELYFSYNYTLVEIQEELNIPKTTVARRIESARLKLKKNCISPMAIFLLIWLCLL